MVEPERDAVSENLSAETDKAESVSVELERLRREAEVLGSALQDDHAALTMAECLLQRIAEAIGFQPEPPREDSPLERDVYVARVEGLPAAVERCVADLAVANQTITLIERAEKRARGDE